ncbi:MAG: MerR family transcriptional regulator [Oscillospiraceae bacterium]|nr:MerR family transcriptional regulator [Oscillospiraceae bacterium]
MTRIGEAAKQFGISNRTLRHWEDMGILKSTRTENDYRYYDNNNMARIHQIILLRKLKMPIADIERIFIEGDFSVAIKALNNHLENLKQDTAIYQTLITCMEKLIMHIEKTHSMDEVFSYLEMQNAPADSKHEIVPQISPSKKEASMFNDRLDNVRIVRLPAMLVAAYCAVSATPEMDCAKIFDPFVLGNRLHKKSGFRSFGFNNPDPSEDRPTYGYETWVTIPEDFNVSAPFEKKSFDGGLFASISATLNEIAQRWAQFYMSGAKTATNTHLMLLSNGLKSCLWITKNLYQNKLLMEKNNWIYSCR